jgi:hypothetical protein
LRRQRRTRRRGAGAPSLASIRAGLRRYHVRVGWSALIGPETSMAIRKIPTGELRSVLPRRSRETGDAIPAAATQLFARGAFDQATMNGIAAAGRGEPRRARAAFPEQGGDPHGAHRPACRSDDRGARGESRAFRRSPRSCADRPAAARRGRHRRESAPPLPRPAARCRTGRAAAASQGCTHRGVPGPARATAGGPARQSPATCCHRARTRSVWEADPSSGQPPSRSPPCGTEGRRTSGSARLAPPAAELLVFS